MSWEALLFFVLFFLPMLIQLLGRKEQGNPPTEAQGALEEDRGPSLGKPSPARVDQASAPPPPPSLPPTMMRQGGVEPSPRPRPVDPPAPEMVSLERLTPRPIPTEGMVADTSPDRDAEHARFRRTIASTAKVTRTPPTVRLRLRGAAELRRAIILSEILGPPRSLRAFGDE